MVLNFQCAFQLDKKIMLLPAIAIEKRQADKRNVVADIPMFLVKNCLFTISLICNIICSVNADYNKFVLSMIRRATLNLKSKAQYNEPPH
jgi:hypothetical protein